MKNIVKCKFSTTIYNYVTSGKARNVENLDIKFS